MCIKRTLQTDNCVKKKSIKIDYIINDKKFQNLTCLNII